MAKAPVDAVPDCLIAGAGPTGLTLALELVRRGKNVRIFDRSPSTRPLDQSRALGILPPTLEILRPSGVTDRLLEAGLRLTHLDMYYRGHRKASLDIEKGGGPYPFLLTLPQAQTELILLEALSEFGVEVEWNTSVGDVDVSGEQPALLMERDGKQNRAEGRLIAGCDGVRSVVRQKLGIAFDGEKMDDPFSLADVTLKDEPNQGHARVDFHDAGTIIQMPLPGGMRRLIGTSGGVAEREEIQSSIEKLGWHSDFSITFRHVMQMRSGPVFLAGDAAHVHSPAGGRGMNTGIADAAWLAWLISENRENEYEAMRLPVAREIIKFTRQLTVAVASKGWMAQFMKTKVLPLALGFDFVQRRVAARLLAQNMPRPPWMNFPLE